MNVTREVILDLLPVYAAGEASEDTRALIEEYLQQDPELARRLRAQAVDPIVGIAPSSLPPDLELRSLRRARALIRWQKWLFGLGIGFSALALAIKISFENGHLTAFHLMIQEDPIQFGYLAGMAVLCWIGYFVVRRRMRPSKVN
jgi:hypothetical protein